MFAALKTRLIKVCAYLTIMTHPVNELNRELLQTVNTHTEIRDFMI